MATLLGADGRPLRATRPSGADFQFGEWFSQSLTDRWTDATEDGEHGYLKSFEAIYRSQPVVASVVDKLARRIATLPYGGFTLSEDGSREPVASTDSLATLIRRPWTRASTVDLNFHRAQSLFVHGNALFAKVRTTGDREMPPDMLWPLDWSRIGAYGPQGGLIEWWSTTQFDSVERFLRAEDVVHYAWSSPSGSQIGISPLEKLGVTLRLDDAAQREQTSMFRNGIRPQAAVTIDDPNVSKEKLDYAGNIVKAAHQGVDKAGAWVWMGANVKVTPLSLSPVEAALIDQRHLNREEVGMIYDMPGPLQGDLRYGTYNNTTEFLASLYRDVIPPWTELIVQTDQAQLLDPEPAWLDNVVRFDFTDKLKGEPKELAETLKIEVEAGLRTRNEARRILGLPPDGNPDDQNNAANRLTANVNNQAPVETMNSSAAPSPIAAPASQE